MYAIGTFNLFKDTFDNNVLVQPIEALNFITALKNTYKHTNTKVKCY